MTITLSSVVSINPDVLTASIDDELMMMHMEKGYYFGLQGTGKRIWDDLAKPVEVRAICANLRERYAGDAGTIEREVLDFLAELDAQDLLIVQLG